MCFRVRRFIPVLITTFDRCTRVTTASCSDLHDLGVRAIRSLNDTSTPEDSSYHEPLLSAEKGSYLFINKIYFHQYLFHYHASILFI